jgi:hypothetical protein
MPINGATGVSLTSTLSWQGGDPDGDPVTYAVAFGIDDPPPIVVSGVAVTSYDPGPLEAGTAYYWVITASDGISTTVGQVWRFTTVVEYLIYLPLVLRNH